MNVKNNPLLTNLGCMGNRLTTLDVSNNTRLKDLSCWGNQISVLDISNCEYLRELVNTTDPYYDEDKLVRVTDQEGRKITGIASSFPSGYGLHEYDREEEGLQVGEYILFESDIARVEILPTYEEAVKSIPPGKYRHYKGKEYEVIGIARHSETEEVMVVYRALYGDHGIWVRPASMWNEEIVKEGKTVRRFEKNGD